MATKFYAVRVGRTSGVFPTWRQAAKQVLGVSNAVYRGGFASEEAAQKFVDGQDLPLKPRRVDQRPIAYRGQPKLDSFLRPFRKPRRAEPVRPGVPSTYAGWLFLLLASLCF